MGDDCAICQHQPHVGRRCGYPITEDIHDDVGIFMRPTYITRTIITGTCPCGLVDSMVEQFGIELP